MMVADHRQYSPEAFGLDNAIGNELIQEADLRI